MVKAFKESHAKGLEKLAADRQREADTKATHDVAHLRNILCCPW
jgi:hypothetical protein